MKKNEILRLEAIDYNEKGFAVCKADHFVVFVPQMLIHEIADVLIVKVNPSYAFGKVQTLIKTSSERVQAPCLVANSCGGCQLQHMSYAHQLDFKKNHVQNLLQRALNNPILMVDGIIGMTQPTQYRNKSIVPFNEKGEFGFFRAHSQEVVPFENCLIQSDDANSILKTIQSFYINNDLSFENLRNVLIKKGFESQEIMVVLIVRDPKILKMKQLIQELIEKFPNIKSIQRNLNTRQDNVVLGKDFKILYGENHITDHLDGLLFEISAASFYQVNPTQSIHLYQKAIEYAEIKKTDTVLDLYCGIGTISLFAARIAKKVIGVEVVAEAIEDAKRNAELNQLSNLSFISGDAKDAFSQLSDKIDVVIVDPPRKGLSEETIQSILELAPKKLIYVSCDPGTLTRDLIKFKEVYDIKQVSCVDMFPHTYHVETVVLMSRKDK